ncbi:RNase H domain protein [Annulohypoxylon maeteangense]|uniref:RNase H domain protein n=1 Tax=Annulohypoxylon maeteangense TaxID=1927788 RepID=UPI002008D7BC|nr:RNase H domain protein [Annulohypoxylon maeteangense]KAI0883013.1 RNase H domain protein [Annulohypoxylon maeteangense]
MSLGWNFSGVAIFCQYPNGIPKIRGTGKVFPTRFSPPTSSALPTEVFRSDRICSRYIHLKDRQCTLVFTDGACLNNGMPNPRAGWGIVYGPGHRDGGPEIECGRLENKGPFGDDGIQSSNRAELRAVIAALRVRNWPGEGLNTIVIATDSTYVVDGSTKWAKTWIKNDWKTGVGADVKNRDLWEMLLGEAERWEDRGLLIQFWKIPRDWNSAADAAAKEGALKEEVTDYSVRPERMCF